MNVNLDVKMEGYIGMCHVVKGLENLEFNIKMVCGLKK